MSGRARRRALGQHFLVDSRVVEQAIELAALVPGTPVLEIGPGHGVLTEELLRSGHPVLAVEIDRELAAALSGSKDPRLEVVVADFLELDEEARSRFPRHVVANLPYSTGTAILERLLERPERVDRIVVMLQREVADRLCAEPGGRAYGALTVLTALYAKVRYGFPVPPSAFRPPPQVESSVIRLDVEPRPRIAVSDPAGFRRVVKAAFAQRRKTLRNALGATFGREFAEHALTRSGVDPVRRAETLSLAEFVRLADEIATGPEEGSPTAEPS
jgi:16S rRNA (adenine1518-N6/adenine1519-N6)-dimethyltransferase